MSERNLVCDLGVFTPEQREKHLADCDALFGMALEVRGLPDGYAVRLPSKPESLTLMTEFVIDDRMCCPFLEFGIDVEPYDGAMWLRLAGGADVKMLLTDDLKRRLPDEVGAGL